MNNKTNKILISESQIKARVCEIGKRITSDYLGGEPVMVCILRGSSIFFADLIREIDLPVTIEFMSISSYGKSSKSSGHIKMVKDIAIDVAGRDVIIVEDIIDSGYTARYLKNLFSTRQPKSLTLCSLLDKPDRREVDVVGEYIGFNIPDEFVVGYGLDYAEKFRNLKDVCILDPSYYK